MQSLMQIRCVASDMLLLDRQQYSTLHGHNNIMMRDHDLVGAWYKNVQGRKAHLPCTYPTLALENITCIVCCVLRLLTMVTNRPQLASDQHCAAVDQVNHGR